MEVQVQEQEQVQEQVQEQEQEQVQEQVQMMEHRARAMRLKMNEKGMWRWALRGIVIQ